jgi:hypothetical protein
MSYALEGVNQLASSIYKGYCFGCCVESQPSILQPEWSTSLLKAAPKISHIRFVFF